jgi:hypothetical protein
MTSALKFEPHCALPKATEVKLPATTVTEITEYEEISSFEYDHAPIICEFQPAPTIDDLEHPVRKFDCEYPSVDPNVTRVREALPFPKELKEVIAWTDAFVDRIASLTLKEEKVSLLSITVTKLIVDTFAGEKPAA